jgi:hypothetical protein
MVATLCACAVAEDGVAPEVVATVEQDIILACKSPQVPTVTKYTCAYRVEGVELIANPITTLGKPTRCTLMCLCHFALSGGQPTCAPGAAPGGDYKLPECDAFPVRNAGEIRTFDAPIVRALKGSVLTAEDLCNQGITNEDAIACTNACNALPAASRPDTSGEMVCCAQPAAVEAAPE